MTAYALPIPAAGSLETYVQTVNSFPLLTQEQETAYARKFRAQEDLEAARQLVVSHLRVVVAIARGYMRRRPPEVEREIRRRERRGANRKYQPQRQPATAFRRGRVGAV